MNGQRENSEPRWRLLRDYAGQRVARLQGRYLQGVPAAKAELAQLRNVDPIRDHGVLAAWESVFVDAPEPLIGHGDEPTREERILVTAMHLYGTHQQSKSEPMHVAGQGLGKALRRLANPTKADSREKPVMRRYHALTTATELPEMLHHLRGLISQMRSGGIPLDYAQLALDLYLLMRESTRTGVRLSWARDLSRPAKRSDEDADAVVAPTD